jgi:ERCC4-related helicase
MELGAISTLVVMALFVAAIVRIVRRRGRVGSGASGSVYDLLNEDKRKAVEIIVEQRAEQRDPETADGNLPELENPDRGP